MKNQLVLIAISFLFMEGCLPKAQTNIGGKGGNAIINVYPQHHTVAKNLVEMKVYVKYNTQDAPANSVYDDSVTCSNHDSLVSCQFTGLKNGKYYFYAYGYDTSIHQNVLGGQPYTVTQQQSQDLHLAVSEP